MKFEELLEFINIMDLRLRREFGSYEDEEKRVLARMVKLTEEVGELSDEILSYNSMQRQEKLAAKKKDSLSQEFADVIITCLLLAKTTNTDIEIALKDKIAKIHKRYEIKRISK